VTKRPVTNRPNATQPDTPGVDLIDLKSIRYLKIILKKYSRNFDDIY
jgi:hypothetical protein